MKSASYPAWLVLLFPFLRWRDRLTPENVRADFMAGLTGAIVVLPQGVAFATIAGMPPEYGLYAGMIPAIIAALWGSSWHLVSGPTTAASIVLFSALSNYAEPGSVDYVRLALTLTFMVGVIQFAMGLARLGTLVNFISHSVVIGFTAGAAILIAANQVKNFFGIQIERGAEFYEVIYEVFRQITDINVYVTSVAVITLVAGIVSKRFVKKIPYMLTAMLVGAFASVILNHLLGQDKTGIVTVGALPASLPPLSSPDFSLATIKELAPAAFAATLFALVEAVSIARSIGMKAGQHIDGNQEFIGQGLSNIAGSFFSGYVATGSFNRSGLNYEAGAKTPLGAVFAGVFLIGVVLLVAPYASYLPNAAMAAILFLVAWGLIDFHHIKRIIETSRSEASVLATTFFSTLFLELEFAILLGVTISLFFYLNQTSKPKVIPYVPDPELPKRKLGPIDEHAECPQLKLARVDGSLFFGAVPNVRESINEFLEQEPQQKHLLIIGTGINFVDVSGAEYLEEEALRRRNQGGGLYLYGVKKPVCEILRRGHYLDTIDAVNIFNTKEEAIQWIVNKKLDGNICATCTKRVFLECDNMPAPPVK